jgi:hypothetical protein
MAQEPTSRQLGLEAERVQKADERLGATLTPRVGDRIRSVSREEYRLPAFIGKIAESEDVVELTSIVDELWSVNEEHVGERILEVEAYFALTGQRHELTERLISWCRRVFEKRSDPALYNPKDQGDPFLKFERLLQEFSNILGRLSDMDGTIHYVFIYECYTNVVWLLFDRTWAKHLQEDSDETLRLNWNPCHPDIPVKCTKYLTFFNLLEDSLPAFLRIVCRGGDRDRLCEIAKASDNALRSRLSEIVADIQEMRPFLVRGFKSEKTAIESINGMALAWEWSLRFGIALLFAGNTTEDILETVSSGQAKLTVTVGRDGILLDSSKPWSTTETFSAQERDRWLPENVLVMELFHKKLFDLWDRIDFEGIRRRAQATEGTEELSDEAIALSCQDLAAADQQDDLPVLLAETASKRDSLPSGRRILPLRLQRLLNLLKTRLNCEVRQGKGSEVTVYRPGGRIFVLGRHARNDEVHSVLVKQLLHRVGIGQGEWLRAVSG